MKILFFIFLVGILFIGCNSGSTINPNPNNNLVCNEYWPQVAFSDFCSMDLSMFDLEGDQDSCHADSNDDLPFDELIYISVYNGYTAESSREDYDDDKDFYDSDPNFMEISDLGDAAFATIKIQFGKLDDTYISILKGVYTIRIEINSDGSNGANDCITTDTVIDFAKAIIAPL